MDSEERVYLIIQLSCTSSCHWSLLHSRNGCIVGRDVLITNYFVSARKSMQKSGRTSAISARSCVKIFRNERTRSTQLDPKLMFSGVSDRFVTARKPEWVYRWEGCPHQKWSETPQNMSFGSNGVDQVRSLRKIPTRPCLANMYDNGTSSASFASTFVQYRNDPKRPKT
jgi:hypothetical protein